MTAKLWELSEGLQGFENLIDEVIESELSDKEKENRLDYLFKEWLTIDVDFTEKVEATACYIKRLEALATARAEEAKRLSQLAKQAENQAKSLRSYLAEHLLRTGKVKVETTTSKISLRQNPPKVCLSCEVDQLPTLFQKVERKPNLTAIKQHLKANPDCDWAYMSTENGYSLTIK